MGLGLDLGAAVGQQRARRIVLAIPRPRAVEDQVGRGEHQATTAGRGPFGQPSRGLDVDGPRPLGVTADGLGRAQAAGVEDRLGVVVVERRGRRRARRPGRRAAARSLLRTPRVVPLQATTSCRPPRARRSTSSEPSRPLAPVTRIRMIVNPLLSPRDFPDSRSNSAVSMPMLRARVGSWEHESRGARSRRPRKKRRHESQRRRHWTTWSSIPT